MKDLQWFYMRRGSEVMRHNPYTNENKKITIDEEGSDYKRHHLYQDLGYTFSDPVRVHSGPPESKCISCEG